MFNNYNPYYVPPQRYQPMENMQTPPINNQPYIQPRQQQTMGLLGKSVDSIDVVKAMDIPLDGSTSYFPLTDGSAIVTKKIQTDGTSKTVIYKPVESDDQEKITYVTADELNKKIQSLDASEDLKTIKDEMKSIKKQIKEIQLNLDDKGD